MTAVRLLMALSLICSAAAFAQMQDDSLTPANQAFTVSDLSALPSGPSAIRNPSAFTVDQLSDPFLLRGNSTQSPKLMLERLPQRQGESGVTLKLNGGEMTTNANPHARMDRLAVAQDSLCYAIRSYVVARDSKHSDSVHPVGYTTCVPASRYQLRTTVEQQSSERDVRLIQH